MELIRRNIPNDSPGVELTLNGYRFGGAGETPKIFLQAGTHADEQPGMLVLHHLLDLLEAAESEGRLKAQFVVFPMVNPVGMAHIEFHAHRGRYHPLNGRNYNRDWVDLDARLWDFAGDISSRLTDDPESNRKLVRQLLEEWWESQKPVGSLDNLRHIVVGEAMDADMVLDLHCDDEALNHIFIVPQLLPEYSDLSDWMGAAATLTEEDSGGHSFDEVWPGLWLKLARRYPDAAFPDPPLAATLEYRGMADVEDATARRDAENLLGFFIGRGMVDGKEGKPTKAPDPTPLNAMDLARVGKPGILSYRVKLGDRVKAGDVLADMVLMDGDAPGRTREVVTTETDGVVISRNTIKYVWPGVSVAKVVGTKPLASRKGYLLGD